MKINKCEYPVTHYETPTYRIRLEFSKSRGVAKCKSNEDCWNVPKGTVLSVSIGLIEGIALKDFTSDFSSYKIVEVPDLPNSLRHISTKNGVELTVINYSDPKVKTLTTYLRGLKKEL